MSPLAAPAALAGLTPISLAELDARAELRQRVDRKYVVPTSLVERMLDAVGPSHAVLEIDGARSFAYGSSYFDTEELDTYRAHVQGRRRRFKVRTRRYLESGLCMFEVKLKGLRGETIKLREQRDPDDHGVFDDAARAFLDACLDRHYGIELREPFHPTVDIGYRRITLAALDACERVTIDLDLDIALEGLRAARMKPAFAIVESKSTRGGGGVDRLLRGLGARAVGCSKYCLGVALTRSGVPANDFRWLARRYFEPVGDHALVPAMSQGDPVDALLAA